MLIFGVLLQWCPQLSCVAAKINYRRTKRARHEACTRVLLPPPRQPASAPPRCIGAPPPPPRYRWQPAAGARPPPPRPRQLVRLPELAGAMRRMGGLRRAAAQRLDTATTCWLGCGRVPCRGTAAPERPGRARAAPAGASAGLKWRRQRLSRLPGFPAGPGHAYSSRDAAQPAQQPHVAACQPADARAQAEGSPFQNQ